MSVNSRNLPDDRRLSNTETSDESTSVDRTEVTVDTASHEDGNAKGPEHAKEPGSPDTSDAVTNHESTAAPVRHVRGSHRRVGSVLHQSATDGSDLDHGGDIGLDVGLLDLGVRVIVDGGLEVDRVESA